MKRRQSNLIQRLFVSHLCLVITSQILVPCVYPGFTLIENPVQNLIGTIAIFVPSTFAIHSKVTIFSVAAWVMGTVLFHFIVVAFGAPVTELAGHTLAWSALQSAIAVVPPSIRLDSKDRETWFRVFIDFKLRNMNEVALAVTSMSSILGAWLGAIPIPLDWDEPWQAWPVTLVYGSMFGALLSSTALYVITKFELIDLRRFMDASCSRDS